MARYRLKDGTIFRPMVIPKIASMSPGLKEISLSDIEKKGDDILYNNMGGYISENDRQYNLPYLRYNNANSAISGNIVFNDLATVTFNNHQSFDDYALNIKYNCKDSSGSTTYFGAGDAAWTVVIPMTANIIIDMAVFLMDFISPFLFYLLMSARVHFHVSGIEIVAISLESIVTRTPVEIVPKLLESLYAIFG